MSEFTVLVTDHDFDDLSIERGILSDLATVHGLSSVPGSPVDAADGRLADADGILNLRSELDRTVVDAMESCRIIARYGIGVDNVDLGAAARRDIVVTNVPDYCVEEVATHALSMALALVRNLERYDEAVASGAWDRSAGVPIHRFSELTVGVVGAGSIGRALARRVGALGASVVASDPYLEPADVADLDLELVEFGTLLDRADVISVHSPLTGETRGLFDDGVFARMKRTAYLVNVSRGGLIDEADLTSALDAGEIAGAGLDVLATEPPADDHPLRDHEKALVTPHVAWYSEESSDDRRRIAAENVRAVLLGERPGNPVSDG